MPGICLSPLKEGRVGIQRNRKKFATKMGSSLEDVLFNSPTNGQITMFSCPLTGSVILKEVKTTRPLSAASA